MTGISRRKEAQQMNMVKVRRAALEPLLGAALALTVCGCGGGGSAGKSGTFFAQPVALNNGTATGYVILSNGRPTAVGMDLTPGVLQGEPPLPLGAASATFGPLPP